MELKRIEKLKKTKIGRIIILSDRHNVNQSAAATAFSVVLSLAPLLIIMCKLITYLPITQENLITAVNQIIPESFTGFADAVIRNLYKSSAGVVSFSIIIMVFSSSRGVYSLIQNMSAIFDGEERFRRQRVSITIFSFIITIAIAICSLLLLVLYALGNKFFSTLALKFPNLMPMLSFFRENEVIFFIPLLFVFFLILYAGISWRGLQYNFVGALAVTGGFFLFTWIFSLVLSLIKLDIYGNITLLILFLFWVYFCCFIVYIGACINQVLYTERKENEIIETNQLYF